MRWLFFNSTDSSRHISREVVNTLKKNKKEYEETKSQCSKKILVPDRQSKAASKGAAPKARLTLTSSPLADLQH